MSSFYAGGGGVKKSASLLKTCTPVLGWGTDLQGMKCVLHMRKVDTLVHMPPVANPALTLPGNRP